MQKTHSKDQSNTIYKSTLIHTRKRTLVYKSPSCSSAYYVIKELQVTQYRVSNSIVYYKVYFKVGGFLVFLFYNDPT